MRQINKFSSCVFSFLSLFSQVFGSTTSTSESINQFATHFYQESYLANPSHANVIFSPYCLFQAVAMTYIGADGKTADEIEHALCVSKEQDWKQEIATLSQRLSSHLVIANGLWTNQNTFVLPSYIQDLQTIFQAENTSLNMKNAVESTSIVNDWVAMKTGGKIQGLLSPADISESTHLILTSAIHFKGSWIKPFPRASTKKEPFYRIDSTPKEVSMMQQTNSFLYYETDDIQYMILPTIGNLGTFFLLPKAESKTNTSLSTIEASLTAPFLQECLENALFQKVHVKIPKFTTKLKCDVVSSLKKLGINRAFSSLADFSKISGISSKLALDKALHEAFFSLDEEGVTASAATAITMVTTCAHLQEEVYTFHADHPFLFGIIDLHSGALLFLGKMIDP